MKLINWKRLSFIGNIKALNISYIIVIILPIIFKIIEIKYPEFAKSEQFERVFENLIILFWSSIFIAIGQFLYSICADSIYKHKNFKEWLSDDLNANVYKQELMENGYYPSSVDYTDSLHKSYTNDYGKKLNSKIFFQIIILISYTLGSILLLKYFLLSSILPIWIKTSFYKIFLGGIS